jgi:excisionase family DNA binding protein
MSAAISQDLPRYLSVKQVADYLHLNEKKIYALVNESKIPATKVTGKWMFPRELVDRWMLETSHGGALTDRLIVVGGDDSLVSRLVFAFAEQAQAQALISYSPTGTKLGLSLMQHRRAEACGIHWGPSQEAHVRHPALVRQFSRHLHWVVVRAFAREQGVFLDPQTAERHANIEELLSDETVRWAGRQAGTGTGRFLEEHLCRFGIEANRLHTATTARSEREAAAAVAMGQVQAAPGARSAAAEFGLDFISLGWEYFDIVIERGVYFRRLFQQLVECLMQPDTRALAVRLGGYDLSECGRLVWSNEERL